MYGYFIKILKDFAPLVTGGFIMFSALIAWRAVRIQQNRKVASINRCLYCEIADHAGRCINDLMSLHEFPKPPNPLTVKWFAEHRPLDSVALRGVGGDLGLLKESAALLAVTQFYSRLAALSQAIETAAAVRERRQQSAPPSTASDVEKEDREDFEWIKARLQSCLAPGLRALDLLQVPAADKSKTDEEVRQTYGDLQRSGFTLRDALATYSAIAPAESGNEVKVSRANAEAGKPIFRVTGSDREQWAVDVEWPDGIFERILTFKEYAAAVEWVRSRSKKWLEVQRPTS